MPPKVAASRNFLKAAVILVAGYHAAAVFFCTMAVAFPNIFKRYLRYSPELVSRLPHEPAVFTSRGGHRLSGWFFSNAAAEKAVLLCHGRSRNKAHEMPYVRDFIGDYNVFVFDFTGHGENPYAPTTIGWRESDDVLGAMDWLASRGYRDIAVMGHSMGAAAAIKAVSEYSGPLRVKCVIAEGVFASLDQVLRGQARRYLLPPTVWRPAFLMAHSLAGYRVPDNAPEKFIKRVSSPLLLLQAETDRMVPPDSARRLAAAASGPSKVLLFDGAHDSPSEIVSAAALAFLREHL